MSGSAITYLFSDSLEMTNGLDPLLKLKVHGFVPGYWQGMRQAALLVSLELSRSEINSLVLARFDQILTNLQSSQGGHNDHEKFVDAVTKNPVISRLLRLTLFILQLMGMPVMGGCKVFLHNSDNRRQWVIGLPAISQPNAAPQSSFALACTLVNDLDKGASVDAKVVATEINKLAHRFRQLAPGGINTLSFLKAAHEMGVPWLHIVNNVYQFGWGINSRWLDSSFTDECSVISANLARDKLACTKVLRDNGLPVPRHQLVTSADQAVKVADTLGYPVVVKPANLDGGQGVLAGIQDAEAVSRGFEATSKLSSKVLVEQFIDGKDYRVRVCKGEIMGVLIRKPAGVVGDGASTVHVLIERINTYRFKTKTPEDPSIEMGEKPIEIDEEVRYWLAKQSLSPESIIPAGKEIRLRGAANTSMGGTTWDVTPNAHPDNLELALKAAEALRLDIAGVDLLLPDIARSWKETGGVICEVNGQPQISYQAVHMKMLQRLVKNQGRIPVIGMVDGSFVQDMVSRLEKEIRQIGCNLVIAKGFEACRHALLTSDTHAVIWIIDSPSSPWEGVPFDRINLLIYPTSSPLQNGLRGLEIKELWNLDERADVEMLFEQLLGFLRKTLASK